MGHRCFEAVSADSSRAPRRFEVPSFPQLEVEQAVAISEARRLLIAATLVHSKLFLQHARLFPELKASDLRTPSAILMRIGNLLLEDGYISTPPKAPVALTAESVADLRVRLRVQEPAAREIQFAFQAAWRLADSDRAALFSSIDESVKTSLARWTQRRDRIEALDKEIDKVSGEDIFGVALLSALTGAMGGTAGLVTSVAAGSGSTAAIAMAGAGLTATVTGGAFLDAVSRVQRRYNSWQARRELGRIGGRMIEGARLVTPARTENGNPQSRVNDFDMAFANWARALTDLEQQANEISSYEVLVRRVGALALVLEASQTIEMPNGQRFADFKDAADFTPSARATLTQGARRRSQQFQLMREESAALDQAIREFIRSDMLQPDPRLKGQDLPIIAGQYAVLQGLQESLRFVDPIIEQRSIQQLLLLRRFEAALYDVSDYAAQVEASRSSLRERLSALLSRAQAMGRLRP
jgi:hypothetical protein